MKAKKSLMALAAIAALSMSSCTQEEDLFVSDGQSSYDGNAVMFGTYLGNAPMSRAATTDIDALKASKDGFGVFAYYTGADKYLNDEEKAWCAPNFMYNQQVNWNGSMWSYDPVKYWPNSIDEKVSFMAYAPHVASINETGETGYKTGITKVPTNTETGEPKLEFTMSENAYEQTDLLYSEPVLDVTKQKIDEKIQFQFKHALTRVGFKRVAMVDEVDKKTGESGNHNPGEHNPLTEGTTVQITKVELRSAQFGKSGTLNLHSGIWENVQPEKQTYTLTAEDFSEYATLTPENATSPMQLNADDKYLMIMPTKEQESISLELTVTYNVITEDSQLAGGESQITSKVTTPFTFHFDTGKAYNFVLHIGLTSVKLDASVEDWDENGENSGNHNIVVNTQRNNVVHLIYDANGEPFKNGSSVYVQTLPIDEKNTTEFTVLSEKELGISLMSYDFLGFSETKYEIGPDKTPGEIQPGSTIQVTKTPSGASKTIYVKWYGGDEW